MNNSNNFDTIIIGAGMSGLAAGIRLSYYDKKVLILEQHSLLGGLNSFYRRKGVTFDVGLHAITNYSKANVRHAPLIKLLRQLKIKLEDLSLVEQKQSEVRFDSNSLCFSNDFDLLTKEIEEKFKTDLDGFLKLKNYIETFDALSLKNNSFVSARKLLNQYIKSPLLIEMLCAPLMFYGNPAEYDMNFAQFAIMFRSIFLEGFSRPVKGVKQLLNILHDKLKSQNGHVRFNSKVKQILVEKGTVQGVLLDNGEKLFANNVLSSAGLHETSELCYSPLTEQTFNPGELSFVEVILLLNNYLSEKNYNQTIMFYNDSQQFHYEKPDELVDIRSGVICSPDNFRYDDISLRPDPILRITNIANYDFWKKLSLEDYQTQKQIVLKQMLVKIKQYVPLEDENIKFVDMFTPLTVEKYTNHTNGAVYGSPFKIKDGVTNIKNLFICGTDQGFLGIVGAMLSGISMANLHCLK